MNKQDIIVAILSKDATRIAEAKLAIKDILSARATQFRADSSVFVAKSLFESKEIYKSDIDHHNIMAAHHEREADIHTQGGRKWDPDHQDAHALHTHAHESHKEAAGMHQFDHKAKWHKSETAERYSALAHEASVHAYTKDDDREASKSE